MKPFPAFFTLVLAINGFSGFAQTVQITFDDAPPLAPGAQFFTNQYTEAGLLFKPLGDVSTTDGLIRNPGGLADFPDDGSAYLQTVGVRSLEFFAMDGNSFDLTSVDLAEYSTFFAFPKTVTFIGFKKRGRTVEKTFTTDGIISGTEPLADFETFKFDSHWKDVMLVRVQPDFYSFSLDNVVVRKRSR